MVVQPLGNIMLPITEQHLDPDKPLEQPLAPSGTVTCPQTSPASRTLQSPLSTAASHPHAV